MVDENDPEEKCLNNNSIETNDANRKRERIVDKLSAAEQAEQIGYKLSDLKTLCKDEIRKQHAIETTIRISIHMAQQYRTPDWFRFDILLIKHLRLLLELQKDHRKDFEKLFAFVSKIFWYFCKVDEIAHHFVNQLLDIWQQMLSKVDLDIRKSIFDTEQDNFKNCVKFMERVGCYAMQRKMLDVILSYVDTKNKDKFILVSSLFHEIGAETHEVYKRLIHLHQAVAAGADASESKKRYIIQIVNKFGNGTVVSKLIQNVWFDGEMITLFPDFECWLDFNLGTKTVEFSFIYKGERKIARIDKYCVGLFKVENSETEYSSVFEIDMKNPMHYETMTNTTAHDVTILTNIRIKLTYGILTEQLKPILNDLLPNSFEFIAPQTKKKKASNGISNNDIESSNSENGSSVSMEDDDLFLIENNKPKPIPLKKVPQSQIKIEKLETKANIKKETIQTKANIERETKETKGNIKKEIKADLADSPFHNVTKRKTPTKSTLTATETSVHYEVNIKMSQTKVEKTESVSNSQSAKLSKDSAKTHIEPTEDPLVPIDQIEQTDDIPVEIDYDDILETTTIAKKNSESRDSDSSDETKVKSTKIVVKAMVHCDMTGNSHSPNELPRSDTISQPKASKPPNYNEIKSIRFDQRYFDKNVSTKIKIEPNSNKENHSQNEISVIKEKAQPIIIVESNNNKKNNQQKKVPVKKGRPAKPKPIFPKNESETKTVRRSSRNSSVMAKQKMSEQKDDVYDYDDEYDEFAVPEPPKPKRKYNRCNSITKHEKKAPVKRASAKEPVNEEPKVKKTRKLYNPLDSTDLEDDLQPQIIENSSTSKAVPQPEDDQLTTASFESRDLIGMDNVLNRVTKNIVRMEAQQFDELFETPCFERGQINETATFSYRKFAMKGSYSRVRMSTDSADETQSKKLKTDQVEDE